MLLELTSDYVRFLTTDQMRVKKNNLKDMNELLDQNIGEEEDVTKLKVRELYSDIFKRQLDLIIAGDPKKPEKLMAKL